MKGRFPYSKLVKYPHLFKLEIIVWEKYIEHNPNKFDSVDYDLRVGNGRTCPPQYLDYIKADNSELTKLRVDVVAYTNSEIYIIEIKPVLSLGAIAQVLCYETLFVQNRSPELKTKTLIIYGNGHPDIAEYAVKTGVQIADVGISDFRAYS